MRSVTTSRYGVAASARIALMKAAVFDKYGGPEVVQIKDLPRPVPGPGEALIKVRAASVNPVDWKALAGLRKPGAETGFPKVLGLECAGVVEETGSPELHLQKGGHVIGYSDLARLGAFAQYLVLPEARLYPKPVTLPFEAAACLPIAACTALQALRDLGKVAAGKKVLVNGASGGVGHFAVQIARLFKADVTAVCGAAGADMVRKLGAAKVIDRAQEDFTRGSASYDIIFDAVAKSSFDACGRLLTENGVYVSTQPVEPAPAGSSRTAATIRNTPNAADLAWLTAELEAGTLTAVIDAVYPLARVREALAYSISEKVHGKIVLDPG